jgi:hypothetical protein
MNLKRNRTWTVPSPPSSLCGSSARAGVLLSSAMIIASLLVVAPQSVAEPQAASPPSTPPRVGAHTSETDRPEVAPAPFSIEVVVKFKDETKVKPILDLFWKDAASARILFDKFKKDRPVIAAASLARATYSGELVLTFPCGAASAAERLKAARDIAARLAGSSDISYAEPDLTFSAGAS